MLLIQQLLIITFTYYRILWCNTSILGTATPSHFIMLTISVFNSVTFFFYIILKQNKRRNFFQGTLLFHIRQVRRFKCKRMICNNNSLTRCYEFYFTLIKNIVNNNNVCSIFVSSIYFKWNNVWRNGKETKNIGQGKISKQNYNKK